jgi:hypothetical protein
MTATPTAHRHRSPGWVPALDLKPPQLSGWDALTTAPRLLRTSVDALRILKEAVAGDAGSRPVWSGGGRLHVAVRGVDPDRVDAFAADLEIRVSQLPGVAWADFDTGCGRLVVAGLSSAGPDEGTVLATVQAAETAAGAAGPFAALVAEHPADRLGAARYIVEVAADVAAITAAAAGTLLRLPNQWLPIDLTAVIGLIQNQDRLRGPLERRFGITQTDTVLSVAGAAAQGLHQRVLTPAVDLVYRVLLIRQENSRAATFEQVEPSLYGTARHARRARRGKTNPPNGRSRCPRDLSSATATLP